MRNAPLQLTEEEIEAGKSKKGGFTYAQLRKWGVPIPPPKGWRRALLAGKPIPKPNHSPKTKPTKAMRSDADPHVLLRQVVVAVLNAGHASDLHAFPEVIQYFGRIEPQTEPDEALARYHGIPL